MLVLGISAGFHDSAAALVEDGVILAAVEQERLTRLKHDSSFPDRAMTVCLATAGRDAADVHLVAHHERPIAVIDRYLSTKLRAGPSAVGSLLLDAPEVLRQQLGTAQRVNRWFRGRRVACPRIEYVEHHLSHAAGAFYPSPFEDAAVLTVDGVGEWSTATRGRGHGSSLRVYDTMQFPHSLGLLYSSFAEYCGFRAHGGEGELMGLAPFGEPRFSELISDELVEVQDDGSIRLDLRYFSFLRGRRMMNSRFEKLFGAPARRLGQPPTQREADLAASVQVVTNAVLARMAADLARTTGAANLVMSGGVALNCVANGFVLDQGCFDEMWVQPAPGDAGSALGSALWSAHAHGADRNVTGTDAMNGAFLGPRFSVEEVAGFLESENVEYRTFADPELLDTVAARLVEGAVVGWFRGRMEFGPRALGHRSILADPRSDSAQERINAMIKERAPFRPFAPAVLREYADDWFHPPGESPYMSFVRSLRDEHRMECRDESGRYEGDLLERVRTVNSDVPATTHVDHSARIQTVDDDRNPEFAGLLRAFYRLSGCPVLLNTSFNGHDEPIVCTPADALTTFRRVGLDLMVLENAIVERS